MSIEMSLDAKMCLTKMGLIYERLEGKRVKLSSIHSIVELINSSLEAVNEEYKKYFEAFLNQLTPAQVDALCIQGAVIYRGANVAPDYNPAPVPAANTTQVYRGQVVGTPAAPPAPVAPAPTPAPAAASDAAAARPKRVYRGQVIED